MKSRLNVLTVDVEDWYQTSDLNLPVGSWPKYEDRVESNTRKIMDILDEYDVKATFFVLGCVAQKFPRLVQEIVKRGHEVGSHGGWHRMLHELTDEEFLEDVIFSKRILEEVAGRPVVYYRAPSWSLSPSNYKALEVLESQGFVCDSSLQPFQTPLSGIRGAPQVPFHPVVGGRRLDIVEFPSTVARIGRQTLPFSGGLYLRTLPLFFVKWALHKVNHEREGMVYVHPWELDPKQPRITKSPLVRFTHYYQLRNTESKLRGLLQEFSFVPLGRVLEGEGFPDVVLDEQDLP